jgi:uncharacterized protein (DUF2235 family)
MAVKRLIICCDGTWDRPGTKDDENNTLRSNVEKIHKVIARVAPDGTEQLVKYEDGVGATGGLWNRVINGATGGGLDQNIVKAYRFIVEHYVHGDEIYLFGFSRGAYTARSVAGLIRNCGILQSQNVHLAQKAFNFYRDRSPDKHPDSEAAKDFIRQYSHAAHVKFIGVWDTVGSLGIPLGWLQLFNKKKYSFHDVQLSSTIKFAFHALAIDERRRLFKPTLWQRSKNSVKNKTQQHVEQVWFTGVHCNVGGGYHDERLSDLTLAWMIDRSKLADLAFIDIDKAPTSDHFPIFMWPSAGGKLYNSKTLMYQVYPDYIRPVGDYDGFNQAIDRSVAIRMKADSSYKPVNIPGGMVDNWPPY